MRRFPASLGIFEHEALMNELMLRFIAAYGSTRSPGRDAGATASSTRSGPRRPARPASVATPRPGRDARPASSRSRGRSSTPCWPTGPRTALVPLGSTEQHGPHLPYATDTWIADALAARFCAHVAEAIWCPTIPIGCSSEHLAFPGTLDVQPETLRSVLLDVVRSLARHGFRSAFIFSAHGGNYVPLADALPALRAAAAPMRVDAYTDLAEVTTLFHRSSADFGVTGEASGHHAGEFETSIVRAIRPEAVRLDRIDAGFVERHDHPQALFYPSLRTHAPSGVVGDPRSASAVRAPHYLDGWVELLVAAYRRENPST